MPEGIFNLNMKKKIEIFCNIYKNDEKTTFTTAKTSYCYAILDCKMTQLKNIGHSKLKFFSISVPMKTVSPA